MKTNLTVAQANDNSGQMQPLIESVLPDYSAAVSGFLSTVEQEVIDPTLISVDPESILSSGKQVMGTQEEFFNNISQALQLGIQGRVDALTRRLLLGLGLVLITTVGAFVAGLALMRAISQPLQSLTSAAQRLATGDMAARAQILSGDEVGQTAAAFNSMADRLGQSLTALTDRTRDLTLAAEVSQRIAEVRDIGVLLTEAVELIHTRFNLYYAQVYLLDGTAQNLVLRAGTGEVGQKLIERRFSLPVNSASLNGIAVLEQRAVIISDTAHSPTDVCASPERRSHPGCPGSAE
jgi:HAMP domain-containing protein